MYYYFLIKFKISSYNILLNNEQINMFVIKLKKKVFKCWLFLMLIFEPQFLFYISDSLKP